MGENKTLKVCTCVETDLQITWKLKSNTQHCPTHGIVFYLISGGIFTSVSPLNLWFGDTATKFPFIILSSWNRKKPKKLACLPAFFFFLYRASSGFTASLHQELPAPLYREMLDSRALHVSIVWPLYFNWIHIHIVRTLSQILPRLNIIATFIKEQKELMTKVSS